MQFDNETRDQTAKLIAYEVGKTIMGEGGDDDGGPVPVRTNADDGDVVLC